MNTISLLSLLVFCPFILTLSNAVEMHLKCRDLLLVTYELNPDQVYIVYSFYIPIYQRNF